MSARSNHSESAAKRASILAKISELGAKKTQLVGLKMSLEKQKYINDKNSATWSVKRGNYESDPIIYNVVIENTFEGNCAEKIKAILEDRVLDMDENSNKMIDLGANIAGQIAKLDEGILSLTNMISALMEELSGLY